MTIRSGELYYLFRVRERGLFSVVLSLSCVFHSVVFGTRFTERAILYYVQRGEGKI